MGHRTGMLSAYISEFVVLGHWSLYDGILMIVDVSASSETFAMHLAAVCQSFPPFPEEYASGGELFDYIVQHQRVSEQQACVFFHQIIAGRGQGQLLTYRFW